MITWSYVRLYVSLRVEKRNGMLKFSTKIYALRNCYILMQFNEFEKPLNDNFIPSKNVKTQNFITQ